jgi:hypothetical protein
MAIGRLGVGALAVAWAAAIGAQERPPMEFAPEEVTRPDAGVADAATSEAASPPTPQEEDREAAPIVKGGAPAKAPAATAAPKSEAPKPAPLPTPKAEKQKRGRAPKVTAPVAPPPPAVPPRLTAHVYEPERANRFEPEEAIEAAMDEVLAADTRLRYTPLQSLVSPPDDAFKALADADKSLADAKQAYADMDLEKAKQLLQTALKAYQSHLPELAARPDTISPMRDGFLELSKVRFFEGNADGARDAIRYALVLDGTIKFNKTLFPQQMKKLVIEARLLYETLGVGKLTIDSDPPGAAVWLNGIKMPDRTPTQPIDAPPGPNFISYARRGYAPMTLAFEVAGGGEEAHALTTLQRPAKNPLGPIDRARAHLEDSPAPPSLKEACAHLGIDMLILVRTSRPGEKEDEQPAVVTGYLYDARPNRIINRIEMKVETDLSTTARVLARDLLQGVRLDGIWEPPAVAKKPPWSQRALLSMKEDWGRFRRWKGFWYVVGGVAGVAVIAAVAGGVASANARNLAADTVILGGH